MTIITAFLIGGALCIPAQILIDRTKLTPARILVLYVSLGVLFGALGWYQAIREFAGCGISVPLIGFGGAIAEGVKEAVDKEKLLGIFKGALTAASGGTAAALVFGYLAALIFNGKPHKM